MQQVPSFDEAVALRLRELRSLWGLSLEDVAASARGIGLDWTRGTVWAIEKVDRGSKASGSRRLAIAEFLLLPVILQNAAAPHGDLQEVTLDEVMPRADHVRIGTLRIASDELRGVLAGSALNPRALADPELRAQQLEGSEERDALDALARARIPDAAGEVLAWARLPVERSVGRRLGVAPEIAAMAGYLRWGRSLTSYRDEITSANSKPTSTEDEARRHLTATRGHATREILNDEEFVEFVRGLRDQLASSVAADAPRLRVDQPCHWCSGSGLMRCLGPNHEARPLDRLAEDITRVLVARYCRDDELRARIDVDARSGSATRHAEPGQRCVWCGNVGAKTQYVTCPRCLGTSVDPEACRLGGRATTDPDPASEDLAVVPDRVLWALRESYLKDELFRRSIVEEIGVPT